LSEQGGELRGELEYSTDLFDHTSMARLAGHFVRLLAAAADDPSRRVAEIELLSPAERQQVAVELNDTAADLSAVFGGAGGADAGRDGGRRRGRIAHLPRARRPRQPPGPPPAPAGGAGRRAGRDLRRALA